MRLASFFSGAGGLDQGFKLENFQTVFANEYEKQIAATFALNHAGALLDTQSITSISGSRLQELKIDGVIGGPPCQSWSVAGAMRGIDDPRGELFRHYLSIINEAQPLFFVAENVPGILHSRNDVARRELLESMQNAGYNVSYGLLNSKHYGVAQDRKRVFFVGIRSDLNAWFFRPVESDATKTLSEALDELKGISAKPVTFGQKLSPSETSALNNHHYLDSNHFSPIFMSRNRVRSWDETSFTIQASASHAPIHPSAPSMEKIGTDLYRFKPGSEHLYRRLTVRECALVQDFPSTYKFSYSSIGVGYRMVGNAVPVGLARAVAKEVRDALEVKRTPVSLNEDGTFSF